MVLPIAWLSAHAADITINGWISDCDVRRQARRNGLGLREEVHQRRKAPVFVDEAKKEVWTIDNPDAVKGFYGDHVTVKATADAGKKSVHIDSIAEAK